MPYVLAVDGGNTKTIALVASLDGSILGTGRSGCGDIYNWSNGELHHTSSEMAALHNIEAAVTCALEAAGITSAELLSAVFNLAGADWPEDFVFLTQELMARGFGQQIQVQNDALGILHAGALSNVGVSVICGTGAAIGARAPDGQIWHASFWQNVGGSLDLSGKALHAIMQAELGLLKPTTLTARMLHFFAMSSAEELLHAMTERKSRLNKGSRLAGFTPLLLDEAAAGDDVAYEIVKKHGTDLGDLANVAARRVGITHSPFALVLAGGVFRHPSSLLLDSIVSRVRSLSPAVQAIRAHYEPIIGVLFSALEAANVPIDQAMQEKILSMHPAMPLFDTAFFLP